MVALNGGYDPQNARGRGMALVDLASGHTVWSFFHGDSRGRSEHLRYSLTAGLALADVGLARGDGPGADLLFDTATVGDSGGQLWALRFWQPGEWDAASQQVSNWYAARTFRVANLGGRSTSAEALRGPFTQLATNVVQPDTGILRTFIGTGDSQNLTDPARTAGWASVAVPLGPVAHQSPSASCMARCGCPAAIATRRLVIPSGSRPVCAKPRSTISATVVLDNGPISTRSAWRERLGLIGEQRPHGGLGRLPANTMPRSW